MLADYLDPCPTCGGSATVERIVPVGSGIDGTRVEMEGQPADLIPEPCPDCSGGLVPSETDIEAVAETLHRKTLCGPHESTACHRQEVFTDQARAAVTTLIERWRPLRV